MKAERSAQRVSAMVSVRLEKEDLQKIDRIADQTFRKRTDVIRLALAKFLEAEKVAREGGEL